MDEASLSEKAPWGAWEGAALLRTLEDMLRRSPDAGVSLSVGAPSREGNLVCGGGWYTGDFVG
jgi:hypothetical protein